MFHVKHCASVRKRTHLGRLFDPHSPLWKTRPSRQPVDTTEIGKSRQLSTASFSDAEVPENNVENVVNVDAAGEAAQGACSEPQFLGEKILAG